MPRIDDKRVQLMLQGANVLNQWLSDIMRQGIGTLSVSNNQHWEKMAALLVDFKLGGIARRIRRFSSIINDQPDWFDQILQEIGQIYLLSTGLSKITSYPTNLQEELLNQAGYAFAKKNILETQPINQAILPLGHSFGREEQLLFRKVWYWLEQSQHFGMELEFIVGKKSQFTKAQPIGLTSLADTYFYPSIQPSRVLLQKVIAQNTNIIPQSLANFDDMQANFAQAVGQNPWLVDFPCLIQNLAITLHRNEILLTDQQKNILEINYSPTTAQLFSLYAGKETIDIFGTWDGHLLKAVSILKDYFVIPIVP